MAIPTIVKGGSSPFAGVATDQTTGFNSTTQILVRDVGSKIYYLDPSAAPFTLLADRAGSKSASNPRFEWYEKQLRPKVTTLKTGAGIIASAASTDLQTDDLDVVKVGDLVSNPSRGEIYRVTGRTSSSVFVVTRGAAGTTATNTGAAADDLFVVGSAWAEGVDVGVPDEWAETQKFNFTQISRTAFGSSRTREQSENFFGQTRPRLRAEIAITHAMDLEKCFLFGGRSESTGTVNAPLRTTGGFTFWATSNVTDLAGASLSEPDLETWLESVFQHTASGDSRVLFCAPAVITALDQLAVGKMRTVNDPSMTYGISVKQWLTSHGTLNIVKHRLLAKPLTQDMTAGYTSVAYAVDPKMLTNRPMQSTQLKMDRQVPGVDGWVDEYLTEQGLQITNPEVHGILKNIGAAA
jgi:hypothetical protein